MENKKKFKLFDTQREGRGIEKSDVYTKPDLKGFFIRYKTYFTRLLTVNLMMVFGNFPIIFALIALSTLTRIVYLTPATESFPLLHGLLLHDPAFSLGSLVTSGIEGLQMEASAMTPTTYVLFGLSALAIFTFGIVNVGTTYLLRNMVKGDPVFLWSDFIYAIRRNWKQALPFGILDAVLLALIPFDIFYLMTTPNAAGGLFLGATIVIALVYFWMRFYIYMQMVTFELSIFKILKNSLIFTLIGFKRNFVATIGIVLLILLNFLLAFGFYGVLSAAAILFPVVLLFSNGAFMAAYASYYKMKEIMIDPYTKEGTPPEEGAPAAE